MLVDMLGAIPRPPLVALAAASEQEFGLLELVWQPRTKQQKQLATTIDTRRRSCTDAPQLIEQLDRSELAVGDPFEPSDHVAAGIAEISNLRICGGFRERAHHRPTQRSAPGLAERPHSLTPQNGQNFASVVSELAP